MKLGYNVQAQLLTLGTSKAAGLVFSKSYDISLAPYWSRPTRRLRYIVTCARTRALWGTSCRLTGLVVGLLVQHGVRSMDTRTAWLWSTEVSCEKQKQAQFTSLWSQHGGGVNMVNVRGSSKLGFKFRSVEQLFSKGKKGVKSVNPVKDIT